MLESVAHSASVLSLKLKYHWRYGDRGQTMKLMWQFMRTKNFLIASTSLLFLVFTVYLASHPGWLVEYRLLESEAGGTNSRAPAAQSAVQFKPFDVPDVYLLLLGLPVNESAAIATAPGSFLASIDALTSSGARTGVAGQTETPPAARPRWSVLVDIEQRRLNSSRLASRDLLLVSAAYGSFASAGVDRVLRLIASIRQHVPHLYLLLFDLGLDREAKEKLTIYCNLTSVCELMPFSNEPFPPHVRELEIGAYKAMIIQACLVYYATVWWVEPDEYFVSGHTEPVLNVVRRLGVAAWQAPSQDSTSALSHPNMFAYFGSTADDFYFHRMLQPSHYVFSLSSSTTTRSSSSSSAAVAAGGANPPSDADSVMLLWLRCVLTSGCVSPPGSASSGCKEKRPKFKYTGCHQFEASALSAALGRELAFRQDYLLSNDSFFVAGASGALELLPLFGSSSAGDEGRPNVTALHAEIELERSRASGLAATTSTAPGSYDGDGVLGVGYGYRESGGDDSPNLPLPPNVRADAVRRRRPSIDSFAAAVVDRVEPEAAAAAGR